MPLRSKHSPRPPLSATQVPPRWRSICGATWTENLSRRYQPDSPIGCASSCVATERLWGGPGQPASPSAALGFGPVVWRPDLEDGSGILVGRLIGGADRAALQESGSAGAGADVIL